MSDKEFSLHKRGKKYYAQFKLSDGSFGNSISTRQTTKGRAESWAIYYIQSGRVGQEGKLTLEEKATIDQYCCF